MTISRAEQIDLSATSYYHCISRCVRSSYLCGKDLETGKDYSHRKKWIVARIKQLAKIFAIDIGSYAVMSNHYHVVICVDRKDALNWSEEEVKCRWKKLFWRDAQTVFESSLSQSKAAEKIALWRARLMDISWFMKCLNEHIARSSNKEDNVKGRFWDGRFKCQALLDEGAVLTAMAYVDLNPIRAKMAQTPEESKFTSIHERIKWVKKRTTLSENTKQALEDAINQAPQPPALMPFENCVKTDCEKPTIDFQLSDYLTLVDETGRILRDDKRGAISESLSPILQRLQLKPQSWLDMLDGLENKFSYAIGNCSHLADFITDRGKTRSIKGSNHAKHCYLPFAA